MARPTADPDPLTRQLRAEIRGCGLTSYALAKESGVDVAVLHRTRRRRCLAIHAHACSLLKKPTRVWIAAP